MLRAPGSIVAALLAAACGDGARVVLAPPSGWASAIVAVEEDGRLALSAHAAGAMPRIAAGDGDVTAIAAFYREPLAELGLVAGPLVVREPSRALPSPTLGALIAEYEDGTVVATRALSPADPRLAALRLPELTSAGCAGGCLELGTSGARCATACTPAVAAPAPVAARPAEAALPAPVEPPVLGCPPGWIDAGTTPASCRPPPLPARVDCPDGEVQTRASDRCAPIGRPCPAGAWPESLPSGAVVWVDPLGRPSPSGDASVATIAEALSTSAPGGIIALSKGDHAGDVVIGGDRRLIGACAQDTRILGAGAFAAIDVAAPGARIEDLTVIGWDAADHRAIQVGPDAALVLGGVALEVQGLGASGTVRATELRIRVGPSRAGEQRRAAWAYGSAADVELDGAVIEHAGDEALLADAGGRLTARELVLSGPGRASALVTAGSTLAIERALFATGNVEAHRAGTVVLADVDLLAGPAAGVRDGILADRSIVRARRVSIQRPTRRAVDAHGARVELADLRFEDVAHDGGPLLSASAGSTVTIERARIEGYDDAAIEALSGASVSIRDAAIGGGRGIDSWAFIASGGARVEVDRAAIERTAGEGVLVERGASLRLGDISIRGTPSSGATAVAGPAVLVTDSAALVVTRLRVDGFPGRAVETIGGRASLGDVDVDGQGDPRAFGVLLDHAGMVEVSRARVRRVPNASFHVANSVTATIADLTVVGSAVGGVVGHEGGLRVASDARLYLSRALIEGTPRHGILVAGSRARLEDVVIRGVPTVDGDSGEAVLALAGSTVDLARAELSDFGRAGVIAEGGGVVTAEDVELSSAASDVETDGCAAISAGRLSLRRVRAHDLMGNGFTAISPGSTIDAEDVVVSSTARASVFLDHGAELTLARGRLDGAHGAGLHVAGGSSLDATDVTIDDVSPGERGTAAGLMLGRVARGSLVRFAISVREGMALQVVARGDPSPVPVTRLTDGALYGSSIGVALFDPADASRIELERVRLYANDRDFGN